MSYREQSRKRKSGGRFARGADHTPIVPAWDDRRPATSLAIPVTKDRLAVATASHMAKRVKARTPSATAEPEIVYVFGPSSTGKSSFGERLIEKLAILGLDGVHVLCDGYTTPRCLRLKEGLNGYDPRTYDQKQLATDLHDLIRRGVRVRIPVYDQATGESQGKVVVRPAPVIVVDGTAGAFEGTWEKYPGLIIAFTATAEVQLDLRVRVAVASRGYTPEAARAECRDNPALFARYLGDRVRFAHLLVRTHADWRYEVERVPDGFDLKV